MEVIYPKKFDLSSCTSSIDQVSDVLNKINQIPQLIDNHTVTLLGEYTFNNFTTNIYFLSGGVPPSMSIAQYLNDVCGLSSSGAVFISLDSETELKNIELFPVEYLKKLIDYNAVLTIDGNKYVILTACELAVNDNDLADQIVSDLETVEDTKDVLFDVPLGSFVYNRSAIEDVRGLISSPDWRYPEKVDFDSLIAHVGDKKTLISDDASKWVSTVGTNDYGLNFVGTGGRNPENIASGSFNGEGLSGYFWYGIKGDYDAMSPRISGVAGTIYTGINHNSGYPGLPVRLVKDAAGVPDGQHITYKGNNGKIYDAVSLGFLYWITEDLQETMFRTGEKIIHVTDDAVWKSAADSYFSVYENRDFRNSANGGVLTADNNLFEIKNSAFNNVGVVSKNFYPQLSSLLLRKL